MLPEPPSANRWWRRAGSRVHLSKDAKDYKLMVAAQIRGATPFPQCLVSINVVWHRGMKAGDLDKRLGVLLDALQRTTINGIPCPGLYTNDSQIVQLWARRCDEHPTIPKGYVLVEVSAT
jgi:Holliday junction resolvase RusA-like endonuclease